jgi:hypothetical protein
MPRTNPCSAPDSTADSWSADQSSVQGAGQPRPGGLCAIHQPNLFPRLSTLAKLFTADYWIVLDDVQFTRRDYQHRARLADLNDAGQRRWLSISTHLPHGRSTTIRQALIVDPGRCRRRTAGMIGQHYRSSPHWPALRNPLDEVLGLFEVTDRTAAIAEASTRALLDVLGWNGEILRSSRLPARPGRSQRLADLAAATGARAYLCGTGGMRYLDPVPFLAAGIAVTPFRTPAGRIWRTGREISALWALMTLGPLALAEHLRGL